MLSSYIDVFEEEGIRRIILSDPLVRDPIESTRPSSFLGAPDDIELAFSKKLHKTAGACLSKEVLWVSYSNEGIPVRMIC